MKKPSSNFVNRISVFLAKFRDASTISIGHEQIKQLLYEYQLKDIIIPFTSKMDTSDSLSDRQKKQYAKVYIEFIDHFGEEILYQAYYERFMDSLVKKQVFVWEVVGHLCKTLISRIHPIQNITNYIIHILAIFKNHPEIHKIIKQIIQNIDAKVTQQFQTQMLTIIHQKITASKNKNEFIQTIMAIVLALQEKFKCENLAQPILIKHLKNDDWNTRKACVDACYAILVVKQEINPAINQLIKELKYDKIKHVRDAVGNYEALYKQFYGQQESFKPQAYSQKSVKSSQNLRGSKSPVAQRSPKIIQQEMSKQAHSLQKRARGTRNETFFRNAKNRDVIKVAQQNKSQITSNLQRIQVNNFINQNQSKSMYMPSVNKKSLQINQDSIVNRFKQSQMNLNEISNYNKEQDQLYRGEKGRQKHQISQFLKNEQKSRNQQVKFNYLNQLQSMTFKDPLKQKQKEKLIENAYLNNFKKKNDKYKYSNANNFSNFQNSYEGSNNIQGTMNSNILQLQERILPQQSFEQVNINQHYPYTDHNNNSQISQIHNNTNKTTSTQFQAIRDMFIKFQERMFKRLNILESRIQNLQTSFTSSKNRSRQVENNQNFISKNKYQENSLSAQEQQSRVGRNNSSNRMESSYISGALSQHNKSVNSSQWALYTQSDEPAIQSNIQQKINAALQVNNIDEAYALVLANNKKHLLLKLLDMCLIPLDSTVQECLLLEVRKKIQYKQSLKWLKNYLIQRRVQSSKLYKIKSDLQKQQKVSNDKNYLLLRNMLIHQIKQCLQSFHQNK